MDVYDNTLGDDMKKKELTGKRRNYNKRYSYACSPLAINNDKCRVT
jgi:hypothetical protein